MIYTVGEMAQKLGVPASTLRYYDKEGLLPFVERSSGGILIPEENKKSEPFSYREKVRIFIAWCE